MRGMLMEIIVIVDNRLRRLFDLSSYAYMFYDRGKAHYVSVYGSSVRAKDTQARAVAREPRKKAAAQRPGSRNKQQSRILKKLKHN